MAQDMEQLQVKGSNGTFTFEVADSEARSAASNAQSTASAAQTAAAAAKTAAEAAQATAAGITIPTALPNPKKLTFTGGATGEYDGSSELTITIPTGGESGDTGGDCNIQRIESESSNYVYLRDLASGLYVLYGYFRPFTGSGTRLVYDNVLASVAADDTGSHILTFDTVNSKVNFVEVLVDSTQTSGFSYTRTAISLLDLHGLIAKIGDMDGLSTSEKSTLVAAINEVAANAGGSSCPLTVETITVGEDSSDPVPVTGLTLDYTSATLTVGETMHLACSVIPSNASNTAITWESSNSEVAKIDNGLITAVAAGDAVITARSVENPDITATCAVSVAAESGGGSGEENGQEKVQLSTCEMTPGAIKADGSIVQLDNYYYADIPYTEGMFVSVSHGQTAENSNYAAMLVYTGDTFQKPEYKISTEVLNFGSSRLAYQTTATLTGYPEGSTVRVSINTKRTDLMDSDGIYYYIPGGES